MTDLSTIARPYAKAIFKLAIEQNTITDWSKFLRALALAAQDKTMRELFTDPRITNDQLVAILFDVCSNHKNREEKNILQLLAEQKRLFALLEIAKLFESYRAQREKITTVIVTSARPLSKIAQKNLAQALQIRLQSKINLTFDINPELIGGAIIRANDLVIDGSVYSKLLRMAHALSS